MNLFLANIERLIPLEAAGLAQAARARHALDASSRAAAAI